MVVMLDNLIWKRRKNLNMLRKTDIDEFNKVLDKLRISYDEYLDEDMHLADPTQRPAWVLREIERRMQHEKELRLEELRLRYEKERPVFLEEKAKQLEALDKEERDIQLKIAELKAKRGEYVPGPDDAPIKQYKGNTIDNVHERYANRYYYMNIDAPAKKAANNMA